MTPRSVTLTPDAWRQLREQAEASYPFEGCGLLLGPYGADRRVTDIVTLRNALRDEGRGRFDFQFSSQEFAAAQINAGRRDLDVVGIYHTHPDHPPRPSATDTNQPMLSGWVNVIVGVNGGRFKDAKAWWREDDGTDFEEMELILL